MSEEKDVETNNVSESEDLDELLQSALDDFEKPIFVAPTTEKKGSASEPNEKIQEDFEKKFKSLLLNEIDDTTFSNEMSNLFQEVNKEIKSCSNVSNSKSGDENLETVSQAINSLVENFEKIKDSIGEDQLPDNFNFGNNEGIFPVMEHMFQMLVSKEVLYPSLLSVKEKYPTWIDENKEKLNPEEVDRYTNQYNIIKKICVIFESESDSDPEDIKQKRFIELLALLQEMTNLGQPPKDFAESLPSMGSEMFSSDMDPNSCNNM